MVFLHLRLASIQLTLGAVRGDTFGMGQIGFGVFIMIVTQFWNSLITTGLVVESASHVIGAQSLKEASERGDSICVQDLLATELQEKRLKPSTMNSWNPDLVRSCK